MKFVKYLIIGVFLLLVLAVGGLFVAANVIDLNNYKENIQQLARDQTGRELDIAGDIGVSFFPWVGLSLGELSMANAEQFGQADFVSIDGADVKVKLLPLLKREVEVKTVTLSGLSVDLQRAADGTTNWQDLLAAAGSGAEPNSDSQTSPEQSGGQSGGQSGEQSTEQQTGPSLASIAVSGIEISDANIRWRDAQSGSDARLSGFNLTTGALAPGQPFDFSTDFSVQSDSAGVSAEIVGGGGITFDLEQQRYQLRQLQLSADAAGQSLPNGAMSVSLSSNVDADLAAGTVNAGDLILKALGVTLAGDVAVNGLNSEPSVVAAVSSETFNPTELMVALGIEPPLTADANVLKSGKLSAQLQASAAAASLTGLTIAIDDTTLKGSASLPDLSRELPALRFDLALDRIDLDRYLPPARDAEDGADTAATGNTPQSDPNEALPLPLELIRQLDIDGTFKVAQIKVANLSASDVSLPVQAKQGVVAANGIAAALYQGGMQAGFALDASTDSPAFKVDYQLNGVEAAPLLQDLLQDDPPISGQANLQSSFNTSGPTVTALISALAGRFNADFNNGSLNGINIGYQLRRAKSLLSASDQPVEAAQVKTDFSALHLGAVIRDGVLFSDDLDIRSPGLRIGGDGRVDLPQQMVDYTLRPKVVGSVEGQGGADLEDLKGLAINIPIRGSFEQLAANFTGMVLKAMRADFKNQAEDRARALAEAEADKLKAEARAKAEAAEQQAREKIEAEKARAEQKLAEELAKQEARAREKADELKEQARDKLRSFLK